MCRVSEWICCGRKLWAGVRHPLFINKYCFWTWAFWFTCKRDTKDWKTCFAHVGFLLLQYVVIPHNPSTWSKCYLLFDLSVCPTLIQYEVHTLSPISDNSCCPLFILSKSWRVGGYNKHCSLYRSLMYFKTYSLVRSPE